MYVCMFMLCIYRWPFICIHIYNMWPLHLYWKHTTSIFTASTKALSPQTKTSEPSQISLSYVPPLPWISQSSSSASQGVCTWRENCTSQQYSPETHCANYHEGTMHEITSNYKPQQYPLHSERLTTFRKINGARYAFHIISSKLHTAMEAINLTLYCTM